MSNYLFSSVDWFSVESSQKKRLLDEVASIESNRLLNTSIEDLCDYFEDKYTIEIPLLREDEIVADQRETQVDISRDYNRFVPDRRGSHYITGTAIEITVPFDGDPNVFQIQPTTSTSCPPVAGISGNNLLILFQGVDLKAEHIRFQTGKLISEINKYLAWLKRDASNLNSQIRTIANNAICKRRDKLLADQNLVSSLGFPLKERSDSPKTYVSQSVRRKIKPSLPPASTSPYKPEPILSNEDYEHILGVINNMALVMERSPSAFAAMDEESLRSHFLVQLNGHYEGQATGETFNYEGKTDILIRVQDRNIFIAECKYWNGPKKLTATLDQLLGYSCWRDTKVAIIIFNRKRNFSRVLESIPSVIESHPNYKRSIGKTSETSFRYIISNRDDVNREMVLTVLAFDVPE